MSPIVPGEHYAHAVTQDRDIAEITARNIMTGRMEAQDVRGFREDRQRAWRDCVHRASTVGVVVTRDKSAWYARQIDATLARIERAQTTIARPIAGEEPDGLAHNNWRRRQAAGTRYLAALKARDAAQSDLTAARARLAWLNERNPT